MTAGALRSAFLEFFRRRGHVVIPSSSLVPDNDPSVLLTTAGMQQLKAHFLGQRDPLVDFGGRRLASAQRCFRTSDIESVGDLTHNTLFEMLGNFSVGAYFKPEAIAWAWEFTTGVAKIPATALWVTVFAGDGALAPDTQATRLWQRHLPAERISAHGRAENFWGPPGESGPCGPSSELHVDLAGHPCRRGLNCQPNCVCGRFLELWNLVFTELEQRPDGSYVPLAHKHIDTGMGLERLARVVQGVASIFETDLFDAITAAIHRSDPLPSASSDERSRRVRIVADHLRAAVVLLADGVNFSNKHQGYVLRRIVRRALDQFERPTPTLAPIVEAVLATYRDAMPWLPPQRELILTSLTAEQTAYARLQRLDVAAVLDRLRRGRAPPPAAAVRPSRRHLTVPEAFHLVTTYGLSAARLEREGYAFDRSALNERLTAHQATSRRGAVKRIGGHGLGGHAVATDGYTPEEVTRVTRLHTATHLLHAALRTVLGSQVRQEGSDITPERLRFDFTFPRKLTDEEKRRVEDLVNEKIRADLPVSRKVVSYAAALAEGALAFFREKYGDQVTVYSVGAFSKELCGGPHVAQTGQVGRCTITSETSSAAGIRRIKAVVPDTP